MVDEDSRARERRWLLTGTDEDQSEYLRALMRAGRLTPERLAVASYFGSRAAQVLLGESPPVVALQRAHDLSDWIQRAEQKCGHTLEGFRAIPFMQDSSYPPLAPIGDLAWVAWANFLAHCDLESRLRAALGALGMAVPVWQGRTSNDLLARLVCAGEEWLLRPTEDKLADVAGLAAAVAAAEDLPYETADQDRWPLPRNAVWANRATMQLETVVQDPTDVVERRAALEDLFRYTAFACSSDTNPDQAQPNVPAVLAGVSAEIIPWALGLRDPVVARVTSRRSGSPS